jgi:NADH-quinone oxidoreductase subunit M
MILVPLVTALLVAAVPDETGGPRWLAFFGTLVTVLLGGYLWVNYPTGQVGYLEGSLFSLRVEWFPAPIGADFFVGVDGISLLFVLLSAVLAVLVVLFSWDDISENTGLYYIMVLILTSSLFGVFFARDLLLFYLFWEIMLIPMYFIIGMWGGKRRLYASLKFVLYTLAGSLLMLVAIVVLHNAHLNQYGASMALTDLYRVNLPASYAVFIFGGFLISFAIKTPLFPLHTWLPDAHVEAPTPGSVLLAGILLKVGIYGFIRLMVPLFPQMVVEWGWIIALFGTIGILYGGLVAWVQDDIKKLVAYSSISHLGFVVLGIFALSVTSVTGGILQGVIHGINTGALFFIVGMVYRRAHDRKIDSISGLATEMPLLSVFLVIASLASIGLPGTNGFVGEFMILSASFQAFPMLTILATAGVIVSALYMLRLLRECVFGEISESVSGLTGLNAREIIILVVLTSGIFWLGLYPSPTIDRLEPSVEPLLPQGEQITTVDSPSTSGTTVSNPTETIGQ